jgi:hypothetical protein
MVNSVNHVKDKQQFWNPAEAQPQKCSHVLQILGYVLFPKTESIIQFIMNTVSFTVTEKYHFLTPLLKF